MKIIKLNRMIEHVKQLQDFVKVLRKDIYIDRNFDYEYNFNKDMQTLRVLLIKKYKHKIYFSIYHEFSATFRKINKNFNIKTRKLFLNLFCMMIYRYIANCKKQYPVSFKYNQVGTIIEKYVNSRCLICNRYGSFKSYYDESIDTHLLLCFDCKSFYRCELCDNRCILTMDCIKCNKMMCIPCSTISKNNDKENSCLNCSTCSICVDVFNGCRCSYT